MDVRQRGQRRRHHPHTGLDQPVLLTRGGQVIDRNVYWLSTQQDVVDWPATLAGDYPQATMSQYADLTQLQQLGPATVRVSGRTHPTWDAGDSSQETDVTITNTSATPTVAFFLRADARRGTASGSPAAGENQVLPITWSEDDITCGRASPRRCAPPAGAARSVAPRVWSASPATTSRPRTCPQRDSGRLIV